MDVFFIVLEARNPRSGSQHGQVLVRTVFQVAYGSPLLVPSHGRKRVRELGSPFYKALIPFMTASPL